jgi:hypothetical protein
MKRLMHFVIFLITFQVFAQTYNPEEAVKYAQRWCNGRNPNYNNWNPKDCANFVSQCLKAGGLNLSKGIDPNLSPPHNGVDGKGCITKASHLVKHLVNYQNAPMTPVNGLNPPTDHDVGDPMFKASAETGIEADHSFFCSSLDWKADRLYCTHTEDHCNADCSNWFGPTQRYLYFHIESSVSDPCKNCIRDEDEGEEGMDCGGPCPPCQHAPDRVIINAPTDNLPADVYAIANITAGNAAVRVLSGQNVNFYTAGTIDLLPGFEVQSGGTFNSVPKGNILGVTTDCEAFCEPIIYNIYTRWDNGYDNHTFIVDVANVKKIEAEFYYYDRWATYTQQTFVYDHTETDIEGKVRLWDLITGDFAFNLKPDGLWHRYLYGIYFYPCQGGKILRLGGFWIINPGPDDKSLSIYSEFDETENVNPFRSSNNIMFQDENSPPSFSIIPNPNPGSFQLETNFPLSEIGKLKIMNLLGITVYETQSLTSNTIQLNSSSAGQYFVVLVLKDGNVVTRKMMVQ